jgi:hypothetical protein
VMTSLRRTSVCLSAAPLWCYACMKVAAEHFPNHF